MKARKLNKKGEVNWYLIAFILSVAVLVLMFWGPLGTWWHQLSEKYNFFQKSVDDRIKDLELFGPGSAKQEDLNYIAQKGSLEEIKNTLEVYKKDLENKCVEDTGFKTYVERVETSGVGTDVSSDPQKWNEYLNFMGFVCDRLYTCLKDDKKTEEQLSNNFLYFSKKCRNINEVKKMGQEPVKTKISSLFENKDIGTKLCKEFSMYNLPILNNYLEQCKKFILIKNIEASCPSGKIFHVKINVNLLFNLNDIIITLIDKDYQVTCLNNLCKFDKVPEALINPPKTYNYKIKATSAMSNLIDIRGGSVTCS